MSVSVKKKTKPAAPEVAADPAPGVVTAPKGKFVVMLGNKCQRYLMNASGNRPERLYLAGQEYIVSKEERDELFQLADEFGVRFFYDAAFIKKREAARLARARAAMGGEGGRQLKAGEDASRVLMDEDGNDIGNAGSVDDVDAGDEGGEVVTV